MNPYQEFLSCQQDFSYFAENYLKIMHPIRGLIPFHLHQFQKDYLDLCEKNRFVIGIKFRQGGYTTCGILHKFWKCMFRPNVSCYVACKTDREAIHIGKIVDHALNLFPSWFLPRFDKNTQAVKSFATTGSRMIFGSIEGIRGMSVTDLIIEEPAYIPNMSEKWQMLWPVAKDANVYAISTPNGADNWFYDVYNDAQHKKNNFIPYHGNYLDHPDYADPLWVKSIREQLGEKGFAQEVLGEFVVDEPKFASVDFTKLTNHELTMKAVRVLNDSRLAFEDKGIVYELMRRVA